MKNYSSEENIKVIRQYHVSPCLLNWPLTRHATLRVPHAPGTPGTFSTLPRVSDPDMRHGMHVTHMPRCIAGSLTSGFLWSRWRLSSSYPVVFMSGIPGACATRNFTYLTKGPCNTKSWTPQPPSQTSAPALRFHPSTSPHVFGKS